MQIIEQMSREHCVNVIYIKMNLNWRKDTMPEVYLYSREAQESSDPSHIMDPLIHETGNIINKRLVA